MVTLMAARSSSVSVAAESKARTVDTSTGTLFEQASIDLTQPPVRARSRLVDCIRDDGVTDNLLVIEVESGEVVHTLTSDECFLRVGDETRKLGFLQRQELIYDKGQAQFDATAVADVGSDDLDPRLLADYARAVSHPDPDRVLNARNLMTRKGEVTAAAYLLFGRQPQDAFPEAYVRVLRYQGPERGAGRTQKLVEDIRCEGPIPLSLGLAREAVQRLQPGRQVLGPDGLFIREGLIPEDAWLEMSMLSFTVPTTWVGITSGSTSSTTGSMWKARDGFLGSSHSKILRTSPASHAIRASRVCALISTSARNWEKEFAACSLRCGWRVWLTLYTGKRPARWSLVCLPQRGSVRSSRRLYRRARGTCSTSSEPRGEPAPETSLRPSRCPSQRQPSDLRPCALSGSLIGLGRAAAIPARYGASTLNDALLLEHLLEKNFAE